MSGARLGTSETLMRRRLIGLYVLSIILVASLALNDWRITPLWTLFDTDQGTFTAGDRFHEWIYAVCDGEEQQVIVIDEGRVAGVEGLDSLQDTPFPDWCGLPTVDHPDLGAWQAAAARLEALTGAPGASAAEILEEAATMPVSVLYLGPISNWLDADVRHAVGFLDALAREPMSFDHPNRAIASARRQDFSKLVESALDKVAFDNVPPDTIERWLAADQIGGDGRGLDRLARTSGLSSGALSTVIARLDSVPPRQRTELYLAVAPRLADDDTYATLLSKQLVELPSRERGSAARRLLARAHASVELPIALLADFRKLFGRGRDELDVFRAIADKIKHEREAPLLLTSHLKDLSDKARRVAATYLLGLDAPGETAFTLGVLRAFTDLHPVSRPKVAYAVLLSEQFENRAVQEACVLAVQLEVDGPEQRELLRAMLRHRSLDAELQARISAIVG